MSRYTVRVIVFLGVLAIFGIVSIQLFFVYRAYNQENKQLDRSIRITLQNVAEKLSEYHESDLPYQSIIHQISPNYYVVNINEIIDIKVLEYYLTQEFESRNLALDFEYAIYDCATDKMVYGNYINLSEQSIKEREDKVFPKWDEYLYYFGVYFPNRDKLIIENLAVWSFISSILLIVVFFFGYAMFIILKQKRLSEIQKDFIHNITHEFKTPLTSISLSADVLNEHNIEKEPERIKRYADIIKEQSVHLHEQVLKVLQSSNNDESKPRLNLTYIDLVHFIKEIIEGFEARIRQENAIISFSSENTEYTIQADKVHLKNIIINLIDNALKYSDNSPVIDINIFIGPKGFILSIKDKGKGIQKKYVKKVFEKFFRVPTGNVHNVKGFGLGLSYVRNVVKAHNWKIKLMSKENDGTEVQIRFNKLLNKKF